MIRIETVDHQFTITLNRPERRNALSLEGISGLSDAVDAAEADPSIRVLVLSGAAGHFCSGADLDDVLDPEYRIRLAELLQRLATIELPTLAVIDGYALGAGVQLSIACDLRMATPKAEFGVPAARLGIAVDSWTIDRLSTLCGQSVATGILIGGLRLTGAEAHRLGFVHRLGTTTDAAEWAEVLAASAPLTLSAHKRGLASAVDFETCRTRAWESADLQEGISAFHDRRSPSFTGR